MLLNAVLRILSNRTNTKVILIDLLLLHDHYIYSFTPSLLKSNAGWCFYFGKIELNLFYIHLHLVARPSASYTGDSSLWFIFYLSADMILVNAPFFSSVRIWHSTYPFLLSWEITSTTLESYLPTLL
jgi:hypothetical protein